ncbi:MAG: cupin domain-containing protein [Gaiellaceae bacterium]
MEAFNLHDGELDEERTEPEGWRWRAAILGPKLGAALLGATLYELQPGERTFPYHYEWGCEEWLIVVAGAPTLRTPGGERELAEGDTVCFREGPDGAHLVSNRSDGAVRVLILSNKANPAVAVYPDSDKIGIFGAGGDGALFRRGAAVDYWEGEP